MRMMVAIGVWSVLPAVIAVGAPPTTQLTTQPSAEQIDAFIEALGKGSFRTRQDALRQLATLGSAAIPALEEARHHPKQEIALAAGELLAELNELCFSGATIRLEAEPKRVRWNDPVELRVIVENPHAYPINVPWAPPNQTATQPATIADAVGRCLDVAEYLTVTGPDGQRVDLRVEPIAEDAAVRRAVLARVDDGPTSVVPPWSRQVVVIPSWNRAWARYPLLMKGRYDVRFGYHPQWHQQEWTDAGIGQVTAPPIVIEVTETAPEAIRTAQAPVSIELVRERDAFVAALRCTWDVPQWVNLNIGLDPVRDSSLAWTIRLKDQAVVELPEPLAGPPTGTPFGTERFVRLEPDQRMEIARLPIIEVRKALRRAAPEADWEALSLDVRYANHCSRESLARAVEDGGGSPRDRELAAWAASLCDPVFTGSADAMIASLGALP